MINFHNLIIFIAGTIIIAYFSWWLSLKNKRYHGIYRFFSFESILALLLINIPFWFYKSFSWRQIFSWAFLIVALFFVVYSFYWLKKYGKPEGKFENTTAIVTKGAYKYIRHPMYNSLITLGIGIFLKKITIISFVLLLINLIAIYFTAKTEEKEMLIKFGTQYAEYMKKTKMFIPFIF